MLGDSANKSKPPPIARALAGGTVPGIARRIAALPYEGLLVLALVLIAGFPVAGLRGAAPDGMANFLFQTYLLLVTAVYFIWQWQKRGQTLPMKTWRFRVVDQNGQIPSWPRATLRFVCAMIFFGPACIGILLLFFPARISPVVSMWFFLPLVATILYGRFDRDRQFLHDRLAGTQIVDVPPFAKT